MNVRYLITSESLCNSSVAVSFSMVPAADDVEEDRIMNNMSSSSSRSRSSSSYSNNNNSFMIRMAIRMSRARWYIFLRRVFHYQNGTTSTDLASNPFNSPTWMIMECLTLSIQILITAYILAVSMEETPIWPMRFWVSCYALACILNLIQTLLFHSYHNNNTEKYRTCVELFFAIWFVMGNVWALDSRFGSFHFHRAPKLHVLCIIILTWNAICYSFPFILFVLLCCCVPIFSSLLGYNINMGSLDRGASQERISALPTWNYTISGLESEHQECCICLASYREKEEIRQLSCSHIFHLDCVEQWLRIISCCPLCKKELER